MVRKCWWFWCKFNQWKKWIGYFLEDDLEYPDELDDLHNDYPLAQEKLVVTSDMLSKYSKRTTDEYDIKVGICKKTNSKFKGQN